MTDRAAPLVSILVRSMDRPSLARALNSAAAQTWSNLELVVVAACGKSHRPLPDAWQGRPLRLVYPEPDRRLIRPEAANLCLDKARGQWVNFLDDDDELLPHHLTTLLSTPRRRDEKVLYARTRVINEHGNPAGEFLSESRPVSLYFGNISLPCATLIHRSLIEAGARFDPAFAIYEDHDFFVNLATRTEFLFVNAVTSLWHASSGQSGCGAGANYDPELTSRYLAKIRHKWHANFAAWLDDEDALVFTAEQYLRQGHLDVANFCLDLVLDRHPRNVKAGELKKRFAAARSRSSHATTGHVDNSLDGTVTGSPASEIAIAVQAAKQELGRSDIAAARQRLAAFPDNARSDEANYVLGDACIASNDFVAAAAAFRLALNWPPRARDTAFKLGYALGRLSRWEAAGAALVLARRHGDVRSETARGVGECARALITAGRLAPEYSLQPQRAPGRISVIVCSSDPERLLRLRENLSERMAGEDWELVLVTDALSPAKGYNRGIAQATGALLVFCQDDIRLLSPDFAAKLRAYLARHELIGVAGTTRASGPSWSWSGPPDCYSWISQSSLTAELSKRGPVTLLMGARGPVVANAQLLDGVFLAAHRSLVEGLGFDEATFDGLSCWDLDFSYRAHRAGASTAICLDLLLFRESSETNSQDYQRYADRFRAKFPQACTQAAPDATAIAWMPMAATNSALLGELAWIRHWASRSDDQLRDDVLAMSAYAEGAPF